MPTRCQLEQYSLACSHYSGPRRNIQAVTGCWPSKRRHSSIQTSWRFDCVGSITCTEFNVSWWRPPAKAEEDSAYSLSLTQWRWPAQLEDIKRLHCYAASGTFHHPPAYCCAIAVACAQDNLIALLVALADMANQGLSKRMSADYICWVLEVFSRLADLPFT